ncbi:PilN domain-containing protein [Salinisphaera sp. Q1T1-3]|uniref:PilN domain-containing protein n=1 Tax=Salinisphaera sp. Q1T1-3 TaxID=2321229 RepID=UPI000E760741|nr:PilN domain-containing protein [Salinisphaera sp. Q1T1-3]RJS94303.1 pilus assembly protein PilN [Salinisphaera sp. Q1T1-3]
MNRAIRINLLDWRAEAREAKRRRFIALLIGAAAATTLIVGVLPVVYYGHQLASQQSRNDYLTAQIDSANRKLTEIKQLKATREALVNRMQIIGELQQSRSSIVHYFDALAGTMPEGVYLTGLTQQDNTTTLNGIAESNARVSQYMTNLDDSPWFDNPRLIVITRDDSTAQPRADFTLRVDSRNPAASSATDSDAVTGDTP